MLIEVVSKGGNLLLNVGPRPDGTIQPEFVARLAAIGDWMKVNNEAIYGTTASPFTRLPFFGRVTAKGNILYLHVFERPGGRACAHSIAGEQCPVGESAGAAGPQAGNEARR